MAITLNKRKKGIIAPSFFFSHLTMQNQLVLYHSSEAFL